MKGFPDVGFGEIWEKQMEGSIGGYNYLDGERS